jgi:AcrR family transcriptional regulator
MRWGQARLVVGKGEHGDTLTNVVDNDGVQDPRPPAPGTRAKILDAARTVFGHSGYRGGRTVDIAELAGITERTLFRHFPTKSELFTAAVVEPVHDYIAAFVQDWNQREHGVRSAYDEARLFYKGLLEMLDEHRGLMVALIAARTFDDPEGNLFPRLESEFAEILSAAEPTMRAESQARGFRGEAPINVRLMFGLAITMSVHGDWLFTAKSIPERDTLLDELTTFTLLGFTGGPQPAR